MVSEILDRVHDYELCSAKVTHEKLIYPKLTFCWNKPNKLLPTMAAIIKTKATIANRALTSFMS